jgi:acyl-coenzyme A synthetase/AMP-(fatty) acid ligase
VIGIEDERAGQLPKAYVVKSAEARKQSLADEDVIKALNSHMEGHKARHKWLKGGIQFIDSIPKSSSGKILRRLLKEQDKKAQISAKI